jgi:hypothetical protein
LIIQIHKTLKDAAFQNSQIENLQEIIEELSTLLILGPLRNQIPHIIDSVNLFVNQVAKGDLVKYAQKFARPEEIVTEIGHNIPEMGTRHIDHSWMYLRWMVRQARATVTNLG